MLEAIQVEVNSELDSLKDTLTDLSAKQKILIMNNHQVHTALSMNVEMREVRESSKEKL